MLGTVFNLQGHRGAKGLKPENTLPSFEAALDAGVTSIETDLHLTADCRLVLCHDPTVSESLWRAAGNEASHPPLIRKLTLEELEPYGLPTLEDLLDFVQAYCARPDKSNDQRARAQRVVLDLELKRVPGRAERIGDTYAGSAAGILEECLVECIRRYGLLERTVVRSFDHRSVLAIKQYEPRLQTAILVAGTAPVAPEALATAAGASIYCPNVDFLDHLQVQRLHRAGVAVLPWTVNEPRDWERLLAWGVDGITTDYPDRLAQFLHERDVPF
jgi:glycerophosphoryl diester phosphodiesterase